MAISTVSTVSDGPRPRVRSTQAAALVALSGFVAVRLLVLAWLSVSEDKVGRQGVSPLMKWDAQWYAGIAENGYGAVRVHEDGRLLADYAFFPLYPWTARFTSGLTGLAPAEAGVLVSAVAALLAAAGIYWVANDVLGSRGAVVATVLWAALPVGVVQSMAYSESLFTALAAWALFAVLRERWLPAAVLACAAGMTRPSGVAVVLAVQLAAAVALVIHVRRARPGPRVLRDRRAAALVVAPMGLLGYLAWVGRQRQSLTGYLDVSSEWGNGFDGGAAFARWVGTHLTGAEPATGLILLLGVGLLGLVVALSVKQGQPLPLLVFSAVIVALALTTSGYFGSRPRHLLPAFPLLFPVAGWLAARRTAVITAVLLAASVVAAIYGASWLLGPGPP